MPSYKLTYFDKRGRAEAIRMVFAAAEVKYEDVRLTSAQWAEYKTKAKLPFGQLPVLEVDGKILAQSNSILKYVARETGLAPADSFEIGKADMIVDGIDDLMLKAKKFYSAKDEELKKSLTKAFYDKDFPDALEKFENILKDNGGKYFAENKLSYADIKFVTVFDIIEMQFQQVTEDVPPILERFPKLKYVYCAVKNNAGVKKWSSERPA